MDTLVTGCAARASKGAIMGSKNHLITGQNVARLQSQVVETCRTGRGLFHFHRALSLSSSYGIQRHSFFISAPILDLCPGRIPNMEDILPHQTMQQFMWQPNLLQIAKFLDAGMKRLQTVDPNEGSNI